MAPGPRILLADDNVDARDIYSEMLSFAGFSVITAADGLEAVAYATRFPFFDVIILDLCLPGIDGFKVIEELRKSRTSAAVPIITLSAGDGPMHAAALAAGADLALEKPCLPQDVERAVRALLEVKRKSSGGAN